jgi:hypothetical protein
VPKPRIKREEITRIIYLRKTGHSIPEICKITQKGNSTVFKYIQKVSVSPKYRSLLKSKQGGSINRSKNEWINAVIRAKKLIGNLEQRDKLLILACLYWGEGNKTELNLNNSDPALIKVFVDCLHLIGIEKSDLRITIRIYEDINREEAIKFWANLLKIHKNRILGVNILKGKKIGKLKYGMCRVRVSKGGTYFKLMMSMIDLIKSDFNAAVVQRIEQDTPNV